MGGGLTGICHHVSQGHFTYLLAFTVIGIRLPSRAIAVDPEQGGRKTLYLAVRHTFGFSRYRLESNRRRK